MRSAVPFVLFAAISVLLSSCAKITLAWADLTPDGAPANPPVLGAFAEGVPIADEVAWEQTRKAALRDAFQKYEHGYFPDRSQTRVLDKRSIDKAAFGGNGVVEEWMLSATASFDGVEATTKTVMGKEGFLFQIVLPANHSGPVPVILMETFCPWWDAIPHEGISRPEGAGSMNDGAMSGIATFVFGRFICTPPIEEILGRGFAIASFYPSSVIPDDAEEGPSELRRLSAGYKDDETRWGAVAGWAWLYSRLIDALEGDERFDKDAMIVWGHSRYGKAALAAAAFDERIDGVIAHQSGTGGASLNVDKPGETVGEMIEQYPHWFSKTYASFAGREEELPIDQHQLLALIAPRPILLGNARRDVWSDPSGAFRAAEGANPVWALYGSEGLVQERLDRWHPDADVAFWIRPGTHGVVKEDWPAFLEFLEAHF